MELQRCREIAKIKVRLTIKLHDRLCFRSISCNTGPLDLEAAVQEHCNLCWIKTKIHLCKAGEMGWGVGEILPKALALTRYASRGFILGVVSAAGAELEGQLAGLLTRRHPKSALLPESQNSVSHILLSGCTPLANISRGLERTSDLNATLAQSESIKQELKMFILPQIRELLAENPVVLFMKGTPDSPECGFSKFASMLLKYNNISFVGVDVLDDPALRQGIKLYGNWPTIPQLYVKGELIGGSDIIQQLHESGELRKVCGLPD